MKSTALTSLPAPLDTIFIEMQRGDYKDFGSASDYPLKGVTFASEYGYLPGFTGEDGVELDFFVGSRANGLCGSFTVFRPELKDGEHKFYIAMTEDELTETLEEYKPVILKHEPLQDVRELLREIQGFKN
ncbi:MAG: hypothetical protein ACQR33_06875 [Candidatus Saccharibacteria bacterium]